MQFGYKEQRRLLRSQWTTEDIRLYMEYIISPSYTMAAVNNPIRIHWTEDWDVDTILDALDELFPLQAEYRHITVGYRWKAVVTESRSNVEIPQGDMEQVRQNALIKWNRALINLGPVPDNNRIKISKGLIGCFTHLWAAEARSPLTKAFTAAASLILTGHTDSVLSQCDHPPLTSPR